MCLKSKIVLLCVCLQQNMKKRIVYGAIAFIWIVIPAIEITFTTVTTDIIQGTCIAFGVYKSYAMKKIIGFCTIFVSYFLPLSVMVFCYARIVHALRSKVAFVMTVKLTRRDNFFLLHCCLMAALFD